MKPAADRSPNVANRISCAHCGTAFTPGPREAEFCCSGCRFVFHLLHKRGLEDFYRYGKSRTPVAPGVFHEREWGWLQTLQAQVEANRREAETAELTLDVQGISCAGCVWLLEAVFLEHPGAVSCRVDSSSGSITLRWKTGTDLSTYAADVQRFGYLLGPPDRDRAARPLRPLARKLGLCGALAMNAMLFNLPRYLGLDAGDRLSALFDSIGLLLATLSIVIGGAYFFRRAWAALRRGELHIDLPISLGLAVAYAGSVLAWRLGDASFAYFDFVSVFTFLMLVGRWLQERSVETNRRRLLGQRLTLGKIAVLRQGRETNVPVETVAVGERIFVPRNALVPVRSRLVGSRGVFALNWINGEPAPRDFPAGSVVSAGARNVSSETLTFTTLESWDTSQLARLLAFGVTQPWRNLGLQKIIRIYLVCVLILAVAGFAVWAAVDGWPSAFQVLISVLVVSCPCAIGVALPLLDDLAAARLQPSGVYLREHSLWSRLRKVRTILFDKTGTLTLENLALANPEALDALTSETRSILLAMVQDSLHPAAACLREGLLTAGAEPAPVHAEEITGMGMECRTAAGQWRLGRASWAAPGSKGGGSVLACEGIVLARFLFREEIRPEASAQIAGFRGQGFEIHLLSGDEPRRVAAMAVTLGLPPANGLGGLTPQDKAALIRKRWPDEALVLGDGANDSLAFDAALCRGTPSVETGLLEHKADFYWLGRSLGGLGELFATARKRHRAARAVFAFAITYNLLAVTAALAGWMNPLVAAIIMPISSFISIGLVLFFLRSPRPPQPTQSHAS